jgi:hypothetical protein
VEFEQFMLKIISIRVETAAGRLAKEAGFAKFKSQFSEKR